MIPTQAGHELMIPPYVAQPRPPTVHGGGEVGSAEAVVPGGESKPEVELGDVLDLAVEGQRPVAGLAPRAARRVEAVGADTLREYADDATHHRVEIDVGGFVAGVADVGRLRERVAVPGLAVGRLGRFRRQRPRTGTWRSWAAAPAGESSP